VRLAKNVFLLTFALFWAGVSAHCQWEKMPGMDFLQCASTETAASHCEGDMCDGVEDGQFSQIQQSPVASFDFVLVEINFLTIFDTSSEQLTCIPFDKALPVLPVCWQFVHRTALPVRAPSFVS
jgi:hypothetical protein